MNYNLPNFLLCPDLSVSMANTLSRKYIENKKRVYHAIRLYVTNSK